MLSGGLSPILIALIGEYWTHRQMRQQVWCLISNYMLKIVTDSTVYQVSLHQWLVGEALNDCSWVVRQGKKLSISQLSCVTIQSCLSTSMCLSSTFHLHEFCQLQEEEQNVSTCFKTCKPYEDQALTLWLKKKLFKPYITYANKINHFRHLLNFFQLVMDV